MTKKVIKEKINFQQIKNNLKILSEIHSFCPLLELLKECVGFELTISKKEILTWIRSISSLEWIIKLWSVK